MTLADEEPFYLVAERASKHDPTTCTRYPCRRCDGPHQPPALQLVDHQVRPYEDRTVSPFAALPPLLRHHAPDVDDDLGKAMRLLAAAITDHGPDRWARLLAWEHRDIGISLTRPERGDDEPLEDQRPKGPAISLDEEKLRREEARTGRYAQDARTTAAALPPALAGLPGSERHVKTVVFRLRWLIAVAEARKPRRLLSREQTATQVAADGWCRSCYRAGVFELIDKRPTGEPFYRDLCRWCGSHKGTAAQPPLDDVRIHHRIHVRTRR